MIIRNITASDRNECIEIAQASFKKGVSERIVGYPETSETAVIGLLTSICESGKGYVAEKENEILGFLIEGHIWKEDAVKHVDIPAFGLGIKEGCDRITVLQLLLKKHLDVELSENLKTNYEMKVFENDTELVKALFYEQFGLISLEAIRKNNYVDFSKNPDVICTRLSTNEIKNEQETILSMYHKLIRHLQSSPVFYPGTEFTDESFMAYILTEESRFYVARANGEIIGMLDASKNEDPIFSEVMLYDVGDIYVKPEFRNLGVAQRLLHFAEADSMEAGVEWLHVEHGTANINARLFWDKHFEPILFSMIREIEPIVKEK